MTIRPVRAHQNRESSHQVGVPHSLGHFGFDPCALQALASRVDDAERHEVIVGTAQLVAMLGPSDGHSELWIAPNNTRAVFSHLPVGFYRFADGVRVHLEEFVRPHQPCAHWTCRTRTETVSCRGE